MRQPVGPWSACAWCERPLAYGNAFVAVSRQIAQMDWSEAHEGGVVQVIDDETLLLLCAACGNRLNTPRLRSELAEHCFQLGPVTPLCRLAPSDAGKGDAGPEEGWMSYPPQDAAYANYLRDVLRRASIAWCGREGDITAGVIDYQCAAEGEPLHQGLSEEGGSAGWIDPSYECVGSCSRETSAAQIVQQEPWHVTLRRRDFSLVSLDCPTWRPGGAKPTFYDEVVVPLLGLNDEADDLYAWLDVMCRFCAGRPLAYFSRYLPSARLRSIAAAHEVTLVSHPLDLIDAEVREEARRFHFMSLTEAQWEGFTRELDAGEKPAWAP